jgi:hypothetical protein
LVEEEKMMKSLLKPTLIKIILTFVGSLGFGGVVAERSRIWQKQEDCDARTTT